MLKETDEILAVVKESLRLDPATGVLTWLVRPRHHFLSDRGQAIFNGKYAGKKAGCTVSKDGHRCLVLRYLGKRMFLQAHRLAFALENGRWPNGLIDHADRTASNNKPNNLREATPRQNKLNCGPPSHNTTGYKGVRRLFHKRSKTTKFEPRISLEDGTIVSGGVFDTAEEAAHVYNKLALEHYGEFAYLNEVP